MNSLPWGMIARNEGHFPILENMKGIFLKIFTY
jgi:hypothetical protein